MAETNGHANGHTNGGFVGTRQIRPDGVDKVTGRARFGADFNLPGQLIGRVLRSPHPHARIVSIDTSKAEALPGVKAVITREDFGDQPSEFIPAGEMMMNYKDVVRNVMAREKVLYEGHAVAAVAATTTAIARRALKLIDVKYEVLPHVIDVVEAMRDVRRMFFNTRISFDYLQEVAIVCAAARELGALEVIVNMSQMTVSQMTLTSSEESRQQRLG